MDTQPPKRLTLNDCKIDWKNHPAKDENGNPTIEDWTEHREQWLHDDCECNEYSLANRDCCYLYYMFDYDTEKFNQWMQQNNYSKNQIAYWGLCRMFNDGWIKSPAFVDWRHFEGVLDSIGLYIFYRSHDTEIFIREFNNPEDRVAILKHFIDNIRYIIKEKDVREYMLPAFRRILATHKDAAKLRKEELKRQAEEEKAKNKKPKEKPEYILSVDEIIHYAKSNPDAAAAISGMLRYYAFEKEAWFNKTIRDKINEIEKHLLLIQAEKVSFEDKVDNVKITGR